MIPAIPFALRARGLDAEARLVEAEAGRIVERLKALPFAPEDVAGALVASLAIELVGQAFGAVTR